MPGAARQCLGDATAPKRKATMSGSCLGHGEEEEEGRREVVGSTPSNRLREGAGVHVGAPGDAPASTRQATMPASCLRHDEEKGEGRREVVGSTGEPSPQASDQDTLRGAEVRRRCGGVDEAGDQVRVMLEA